MLEVVHSRPVKIPRVVIAVVVCCAGLGLSHRMSAEQPAAATNALPGNEAAVEHFEKKVRPLLTAKCWQCHGEKTAENGPRLDSADAVAKGGDSGPVIVPGEPDESRLIDAVRQSGDLKMPPDERLTNVQVADLVKWVQSGAVWPRAANAKTSPATSSRSIQPMLPGDAALAPHLQLWLKADSLELADGQPVVVWPDRSGHERNLVPLSDADAGGVNPAPRFTRRSRVNRRPALRFRAASSLATSVGNPLDLDGDGLTLIVVANLQPNANAESIDAIVGIGDFASNNMASGNPVQGEPLPTLLQTRRTAQHQLVFISDGNRDTAIGTDTIGPLDGRPLLLTISKTLRSDGTTIRLFINGEPSGDSPRKGGDETAHALSDTQLRGAIRLYLGWRASRAAGFRGDIAELILYDKSLSTDQRQRVEAHLAEKYAIVTPSQMRRTTASFADEQKNFWAFQPPRDPPVPQVQDTARHPSPIDRFIRAKLEQHGLRPSPPVDRRALLRRVTFDLTGLPPTPEEIKTFLRDESSDALAKVVDRLLDSPHYGERWARHWLDVVRYAGTTANDANAVMRYACRYRNYVIDAFNRDLPYDQFIIEQLAGDLLPSINDASALVRRTIATGFLMIGPKALAETDKEQTRMDIVDEQIDVTGRAFLGLTLACARCHDHKFDPIPTVDYYGLAGIFRGTEVFKDEVRNASMWQEWPLLEVPGERPFMVMAPKEALPVNLRIHVRGNRFDLGQIAPRRFPQILAGSKAAHFTASQSGRLELGRWIASKDNPLTARVMVNRIWQHHFGTGLVATSDNFGARGDPPSHPDLLDWLAMRFIENGWSVKAMHRLMLVTSTYQMRSTPDENALTIDPNNRLLWRMPRKRLEAESLRDAILAVSGQLDRTIGGSEAGEILYNEAQVIDAERGFAANRVQTDHDCYNLPRRSIYLPVVRNALPDVLALFDVADGYSVTAVRNETTVPSQSLFMLNNPLVRRQARHFATSLPQRPDASDRQRLETAYLRALGRQPSEVELADAEDFLARYVTASQSSDRSAEEGRLAAWQSFCQMLFCLNEFLYLE